MARTLINMLDEISYRLGDPLRVRNTKADLIRGINYALDEISFPIPYEKQYVEFYGSDFSFERDGVRYYSMPSDMMMLDQNYGIKINGLRRLPTSDREVDLFQAQSVALVPSNMTTTIGLDDYFTLNFSGLILHYCFDWVDQDDVAAGGSGKVMWFPGGVIDTDVIGYQYIKNATHLSGDSDVTQLLPLMEEVLVCGGVKRASIAEHSSGMITTEVYDRRADEYKVAKAAAERAFHKMKTPDKQQTVKSPRQVGHYNSRTYADGYASSGSGEY